MLHLSNLIFRFIIHQSLIKYGCFSFSRSKVKVMTFRVSKWFWSRKNAQIRFNSCTHMANITKNIVWKFRTPRSKVKVTSEVKVTPKIKSSGNLMKRVENWKSHFQNFHTNLTFLVDLVIFGYSGALVQCLASSFLSSGVNKTHCRIKVLLLR